MKYRPAAVRFWEKVDCNGPIPETRPDLGPCWVWTAFTNELGYGRFSPERSRRKMPAHRWSYERSFGPIPDGLVIDHLCRTRHCVRPTHLEPVTQAENLRRGEGASACNARKTHCPAGHAYDEDITYIDPKGNRHCRVCGRERARLYRRNKQEAARV